MAVISRRTVDKLTKDKESLLKELNKLKDQLAEAAGDEPSKVMNALNVAYDRLSDQVSGFLESDFAQRHGIDEAVENGRARLAETKDKVQEHPVQSILIAMGVGAVAGLLLRRS